MQTSIIRGVLTVLALVAFIPIVHAMQVSGSSSDNDGVLDSDEDVKWMHNLYTPDAVTVGSTYVWTHIDLEIFHWGTEPAAGGSTGGTPSPKNLSAHVRAENDEVDPLQVAAGWSFYSSGKGGSAVANASINCSYTVKLKKLVVNKNGTSTTYTDVSSYTDALAGNDSLPHNPPAPDGGDLDYVIPVGGFYQITATGRVEGSWSGANGDPGPTSHGLVPASSKQMGVEVKGDIEIDIDGD